MKVRIASPLRSYTGGQAVVEAEGDTAAAVIEDLDRQFAGIRFRIVDEQSRLRPHVRVWADAERIHDIGELLDGVAELTIMQALSGG
jgi:sulfur-carrier protein